MNKTASCRINALPMIINAWRVKPIGMPRRLPWDGFEQDLSQRWIIEGGLLAATSVTFDGADHILAGHFGLYPETYEQSLKALRDNQVISEGLYDDGSRAWGGSEYPDPSLSGDRPSRGFRELSQEPPNLPPLCSRDYDVAGNFGANLKG